MDKVTKQLVVSALRIEEVFRDDAAVTKYPLWKSFQQAASDFRAELVQTYDEAGGQEGWSKSEAKRVAIQQGFDMMEYLQDAMEESDKKRATARNEGEQDGTD